MRLGRWEIRCRWALWRATRGSGEPFLGRFRVSSGSCLYTNWWVGPFDLWRYDEPTDD